MPSFYVSAPAERNTPAPSCTCIACLHGNAADRPKRRRVYPSDLTDAQWRAIASSIPIPAWFQGRGGQPEAYCHREMLDAMLYLVDNGTKWRALPVDFPHWKAVHRCFTRWREHGIIDVLHDRLRRRCRQAEGRSPEPTAVIIDSQSLRAAETVGAESRGYDAGKKVNGRKRHIAVDTLGLLLVVYVTAAGTQDRDGARPLLSRLARTCLRIRLAWADGGYAGQLVGWAKEKLRIAVQIVKRSDDATGFVVLPRRWVVERTLSWLVRRRRCVRDYERLTSSHEAMVRLAMILPMARRLARSSR